MFGVVCVLWVLVWCVVVLFMMMVLELVDVGVLLDVLYDGNYWVMLVCV